MLERLDIENRVFLFLQGPHGPFFCQLGKQLEAAGASIWRVGFNAGDRVFWPPKKTYIAYRNQPAGWTATFSKLLKEKSVTDLVLYGDTRLIHSRAINQAKAEGIRIHVFEEGYMRPYWITYERDGSNGNSALMHISLDDMCAAQDAHQLDPPVPPSHWGDTRHHIFYGALYHWFVLVLNFGYRHFKPHRDLTVAQEFLLYLRKLCLIPVHATERRIASYRIKLGKFPYHLALLQLAHDASFKAHGPFQDQSEFIDVVLRGFAAGAPKHHHLVFKAHPLEDGRLPLRKIIKQLAAKHGLTARVHYVRGGKLAGLLNDAKSAVTVNSTSGQQALWRGIPLRSFGSSIYDKDELVSRQGLPDFFRDPEKSNPQAYRIFRDFLLSTSQLPGGYYSANGRRQLLRHVTDLMLAADGPYVAAKHKNAADKQHIRIVR